jgi:hypothetical protein
MAMESTAKTTRTRRHLNLIVLEEDTSVFLFIILLIKIKEIGGVFYSNPYAGFS